VIQVTGWKTQQMSAFAVVVLAANRVSFFAAGPGGLVRGEAVQRINQELREADE